MSFRLDAGEQLCAQTRRIAAEQIDKAIAELSAPGEGRHLTSDPHEAIHDARKRFKKLRALFRLVGEGNAETCRARDQLFRNTARTLSSVRDRTALIEALDALEKDLGTPATADAFATLRATLLRKRDKALAAETDLGERIAGTLAALEKSRDALADLHFPDADDAAILSAGYRDTYGAARAALKRADKHRDPEDLHTLRRHVKYLGFHASLLAPLWPEAFAPLRAAAATIADALGRDHDYSLFREAMRAEPAAFGTTKHRDVVLGLMVRRQQELQALALPLARRLLAEKPKPAAARIKRLYAEAAREAARDTTHYPEAAAA